MRLKFQLSRLASNDLENIWEYTYTNWSLRQADNYVKQIMNQINNICINPELGRQIISIKPNHRMIKINSHFIVYKVDGEVLKIDRIVHERMDIPNRIG
ncbi:type II toxin-antitoxin system RelE/ParE family toxin [uncultured Cyclobacterium sp.]|uniref:type II toxin-antitoxin system RelE/ParE family toxin n=1 Tax=uncultured Cyclobacterium sp. TaxID=453820 RepID=UPI0030ED52D0|tara:strand:- start:182 stop:478 length:297 start_codon:yes stop_codon:yes gene_type:complete